MKPSASRSCKDSKLLNLFEINDKELILSLDSEDNQKGKTFMVNIFDGFYHYTFKNTEAAIEYIINRSKKYKITKVFVANLGYDLGNLFRESQETLSINMAGSRFITAKIYLEKIKFLDILNIIPGSSVKKLGKLIGLEKLDSGNDFNNEIYCQRDTEIVFWAYLYFENVFNKLNVKVKNTAASTGFSALLKKYPNLEYNLFSEYDHEFLKQGYMGGRTEVFNTSLQKGDIYGYDIVSSYPYAMSKIPIVDTRSKKYIKKPNFELNGMCECIISAPKMDIPYLAVKYDNKLIFPTGEFYGVWTYFEIRRALSLGYKIKEVKKALEFEVAFDFNLSEFVNKFFKLKDESKENKDFVMEYAAKIILNASYGKLALGNDITELMAFDEFHNKKGDFSSEIFPNNQILVKSKKHYMPSTNYYTASLITAYGRDELFNYLSENKGLVLYCDTDSIFYKGEKLKLKNNKNKLGALELKDELIEAHFVLPKTYYLKYRDNSEIYKCKGVWGDLARDYFIKGYVKKLQPLKYVETCRKNFFIKERNKKSKLKEAYLPFNLWVDKIKAKNSDYNKRIVNKDGTTQPIKLKYNLETALNELDINKNKGKNIKTGEKT